MSIVITTLIVLVVVGGVSIYVGRKKQGEENWMVGGRSLPVYVVIGTQLASAQGGGLLVAHVGIGYEAGWSALTYGLIVAIGLFVFLFVAKWLRIQKFTTMPQIIKKLYGENKFLMSLTTLMTIIIPFGWVSTQLLAFGKLFADITDISLPILMIVFAAISLVFVLPAGLASVAWTDFIFGCIMIIMAVVSAIFALNLAGGWETVSNSVPDKIIDFPKGMGAVGLITIALWVPSLLPGTLTNQMYYQRIYASKNVNTAKWSLVITGILVILTDVWASLMGISIHSMNPGLEDSEMAAGLFLTKVPVWFLALYSAFIISAIMSTVSSAVQSVVTNITRDIYKSYINTKVSERKILNLSKLMSIVVLVAAILLALVFPTALDWLVATYAYSASGLLVPIFLGFALKNTKLLTQKGAMGSMILGLLGTAIAHIAGTAIPYVIYGIASSLIGIFFISYLTKNKSQGNSSPMQT